MFPATVGDGGKAKQSKSRSRAYQLDLLVYLLCCIVCLGEGDGDCALTEDPDRPPPSPHPKKFIKIGLSPYRLDGDFCHCRIEDWGVIIFVCGGRKSKSKIKSSAIRTVCVNFVPYRLFGGGRQRLCPNGRSRSPSAREACHCGASPHPKEFSKIGLRHRGCKRTMK